MRTHVQRLLQDVRAPDEGGAEQRAWAVVRSAYREREPVPVRRSRRRFVLTPAVAVILGAFVLSPAGATVEHLISTGLGVRHAAAALSSLPSPGQVLVSGPGGTWIASADGSTRHLGPWSQASWSPRGLYVAVASGDRLAAVDPHGHVQWAITRPRVSDPRWYSPSGYRIAYLSAGTLRVVAGDKSADHLLATGAAPVAPAWRPGQALGPFDVAYATDDGRVVVRDGDTDQVVWTASPAARPRQLTWSGDGRRLLVLTASGVETYTDRGALVARRRVAASDAALSPNGRTLALVLHRDQVVVDGRQLFAGAGVRAVTWSPDGRWLLVDWPTADQWVFLRVTGSPHIAAVSRIAQQFSSTGATTHFPQLDGWCCTAR